MSSSKVSVPTKRLTALDYASNELQKTTWRSIHSQLGNLLRTNDSDLIARVEQGLPLLKELVSCQERIGTMVPEFRHELFKVAEQVLFLMLRSVEKYWELKADTLVIYKWEMRGTEYHKYRERPKNKGAKQWRRWAIVNQLDHQHSGLKVDGFSSVDAGKNVLMMCICIEITVRMQKMGGQPEPMRLDKISGKEEEELFEEMGICALWALAGFGSYVLANSQEQEIKIGDKGFGVRRWGDRLLVESVGTRRP